MHIDNKAIKKYYREIKKQLPHVPKERRAYLSQLRKGLEDFYIEHPSATLEQLNAEYGTVDQICENFKEYTNFNQLSVGIRNSKIIVVIITLIAFVVLSLVIIFAWDFYSYAPASVDTELEIIFTTELPED